MSSNARRLGLALSGGGFRAAFFHLGVLRRLAQYDLLRHVTTISTVSGGSIVAAHYYLYFRQKFDERQGRLTARDYLDVVRTVEEQFIEGNKKDVRNCLLANPLAHLGAIVMGRGYGKWMSRLYTRHFYRKVIRETFGHEGLKGGGPFARRGLPLHRAILSRPSSRKRHLRSSGYPDRGKAEPPLLDVNRESPLVNIPRLVINATCLNTGGPFQFMMNEVGGPGTGYVRTDEVFMLLQYKALIESMGDDVCDPDFLEQQMADAIRLGHNLEGEHPELPRTAFRKKFPAWTADHLYFFLAARMQMREPALRRSNGMWRSAEWDPWLPEQPIVRTLLREENWYLVERLLRSTFGEHRQAKVAAWYLLDRANWHHKTTRGGFSRADYVTQFWRALEAIDPALLHFRTAKNTVDDELAYFILDLYYLRSADALDWQAPKALNELTLSDAVAASANFPPVFTPFKIFGLFKPDYFRALSLTDGGVYDNQGVDALLEDRCTYIIASDAGGLVHEEPEPPEARIPMMDRIIDVLMGAIRNGQMAAVQETCRVTKLLETTTAPEDALGPEWQSLKHRYALKRAAVFHMSSNPADSRVEGSPEFEPQAVARLRTDLDAFNDLEIGALRYQGYQLADRFARWFVDGAEAPFRGEILQAEVPVELYELRSGDVRVLEAGRRVFGRLTKARPLHTLSLALAVALVAAWLRVLPWEIVRKYWELDFVPETYPALRAFIGFFFSGTSVITLALLAWCAVVAAQLVRSKWRRRKRTAIRRIKEVRRSQLKTATSILLRMPNVVSVAALLTFFVTGKVKWLVGFLPLWSIPVSIAFGFLHFVCRHVWARLGALPTRSGPPPTPLPAPTSQ